MDSTTNPTNWYTQFFIAMWDRNWKLSNSTGARLWFQHRTKTYHLYCTRCHINLPPNFLIRPDAWEPSETSWMTEAFPTQRKTPHSIFSLNNAHAQPEHFNEPWISSHAHSRGAKLGIHCLWQFWQLENFSCLSDRTQLAGTSAVYFVISIRKIRKRTDLI